MLRMCGLTVLILVASVAAAIGQTVTATASDPQAVALASQALSALGTTQVTDVTLTGTATYSVGPDVESASLTLKASGTAESRMDLSMRNGMLREVRSISNTNNMPQGFWVALDGTVHQVAIHNCSTDAAWFFPRLSVLNQLSNPNLIITYLGLETRAGESVQHLHFFIQAPTGDATGTPQRLTSEDIYLDATSLLPVAYTFNTHPDNDSLTNIPVEVDFSAYHAVSGISIPFRVQKYFNGNLQLDITIQSAVLNSGLTSADFTAQ
jgi:hypothetical protein